MSYILHNYKFYWNETIIYIHYREFIYVKEENYFQNKHLIDRNKLSILKEANDRPRWCIIIYLSKREHLAFFSSKI